MFAKVLSSEHSYLTVYSVGHSENAKDVHKELLEIGNLRQVYPKLMRYIWKE